MTTYPRPPQEPDEPDYEAMFADIVARWDEPGDDEAGAEPERSGPGSSGPSPAPVTPASLAGPVTGWRVHVPPPDDDEEDDYVPPPPAPLPQGDLSFWGALTGLVVGPIWLLYLVVAQPDGSRFPMLLAVGVTVAGFALLVSRLPSRRRGDPDDPDADDGAVV